MSDPLSRRERQIMDILHRVGRATVGEVRAELEDPPTYSTVRALMTTLEVKGHLGTRLRANGTSTRPPRAKRRPVLWRVVETFFAGSPARAALALVSDASLAPGEREALEAAIASARQDGR
jgi:BlaI family penicillinase repressor